ncbi:MAG: formate dehydrogenase accessory protein FdhE [Acidobacteria bacterium]|nr:formate dehydrogenase accessory protein FdhE [Acidobacteriota bacterium]
MPHVPVADPGAAALAARADGRWAALEAARPDLAPALALQRRLLSIVIRLSSSMTPARLPRLSLPPRYVAAKLARGVPALAGEPIPVPGAALAPALDLLCRELADGGAGEAAAHIGEHIASGRLDAASLLTASVNRDQQAIREGAIRLGLAPDLVWLVGELAASPFVHALQRAILAGRDLAAALDAWRHGCCPACGSWPAMAEVAAGYRTLRCSFCAAAWALDTYACIYCGDGGESFTTAAPDEARKDRRLELCRACGSYLKTADADGLSPFPLLAIADLETLDLDVAAMEHGYARPALRLFPR